MDRLEEIRSAVDGVLHTLPDTERRDGVCHLYGVAGFAAVLAVKRGLLPDLAATAAMLHDIYAYRTGIRPLHAHNGAEDARVILRDCGRFTAQEQAALCAAIFHHSDKQTVHAPLDEALKDADVLQHHFYNTAEPLQPNEYDRLAALHRELGLPFSAPRPPDRPKPAQQWAAGRRARLAALAGELARRPLVGNAQKSGPEVFPIIRYFPDATPEAGFDWCAAFVYHCCMLAGLRLPIRYLHPAVPCRFAGVPAWRAWAALPETGFFHGEREFRPAPGDIVLYDKAVSDRPLDHIGVVLSAQGDSFLAAEGNVGNRSAVLRRGRFEHVHGFLRIPDDYVYNYELPPLAP